MADDKELHIIFGGMPDRLDLPLSGLSVKTLLLLDYDNDGWLDIAACGNGLRLWRNAGKSGFQDVTAATGLDQTRRRGLPGGG